MSWLINLFQDSTLLETVLYIVGPSAIIAVIILNVFLVLKDDQIKKLQNSLKNLQKTYSDLDNQAKLIIKTDLELQKTQSELDKKIAGLYTLQKISRVLSTTLDENEIFEKISEEYLTELGFDKAISFLIDPTQFSSLQDNLNVKLKFGYNENEIEKIFDSKLTQEILYPVIKQAQTISSLDPKIDHKVLSSFAKICEINSFVCAPISMKEGIIGILFVGSESIYSPITLGDKDTVSILATQIGQSLENAKLFEETWRSHQELENKVKERTKELTKALE
ncbi:GAF domain-containing protein, partial [bacterium]|nr:GAF domain-containing protein [bacterium]